MNRFLLQGLTISTLVIAQIGQAQNDPAQFPWPKGQKAAISLSYDDALDSQLDNVIPALNKYKLKGTFYLSLASASINQRLPEWRAAAKNGHELANHTLFHQCAKSPAGRDWVDNSRDLDKMSVQQIKDQIILANTMLYAIDGKRERTFTAPCIDKLAGGINYIDAIKSEFVAIKLEGGGVTPDMYKLEPYDVSVYFPNNVSGAELIAIAKEAAAKGTMANFTFHGVGANDAISVTNTAHNELLSYLAANKNIYWVDTFINEMKYVKAQQHTKQ
jgi:peptidoglycan/xylan/chitin deacetylase (PgdA/CDA1 family)